MSAEPNGAQNAFPPATPESRAAAALPQRPPGHRWPPALISLRITPYAFVPELAPTFHDPANWLDLERNDPREAMERLCERLQRPAQDLRVVEEPASRTVEIHGFLRGHDKAVPLAMVAFGLTAKDCRRELADLARSAA